MKTMKNITALAAALILVLGLFGCLEPKDKRPFGYSVKQAIAAQTLNPEAGGVEPVTGLDGNAGAAVLGGYQSSFVGEGGGKEKGALTQALEQALNKSGDQ